MHQKLGKGPVHKKSYQLIVMKSKFPPSFSRERVEHARRIFLAPEPIPPVDHSSQFPDNWHEISDTQFLLYANSPLKAALFRAAQIIGVAPRGRV